MMQARTQVMLAGGGAAAAVLGGFLFWKIKQLQTPESTAAIQAQVMLVADRAAQDHIANTYGLTPERINAISAFGRRF